MTKARNWVVSLNAECEREEEGKKKILVVSRTGRSRESTEFGVRVEVMPRRHGPGGLELFRVGDSRGAFRTRQYEVRGTCRVSERREEGG